MEPGDLPENSIVNPSGEGDGIEPVPGCSSGEAAPDSSGVSAEALLDPLLPGPTIDRPMPWSIDVNVSDKICYALAHNRTPIVHWLRVTGNYPPASRHLNVRISSAWAREGRPPLDEASFSIEAPQVGETVELSPVLEARLDHIALGELESTVPAEITVTVADESGNQQRSVHHVDIYARNQWLGNPRFVDVTAAFVQPNHPDVAGILGGASRRMAARGESGQISGYQEGPEHVVEIARGIYEELSDRLNNYVNPPADLEVLGQQVRPLDQVLSERQGTCIDLALAFASCARGAGLHPVIVKVDGHAFPGVLLEEIELNRTYINSWPEVQSLLDSKVFFGLESTLMPSKAPFAAALESVRKHYNELDMRGVLDVAKAQREGIRPLPAQVRRGDELVIVIDNGPTEPPVIERRDATTRRLLPDSVPARVQSWKNSLLDLSFRNRLLNLRAEQVGIRLLPPLGRLGHIEDHLANGDALLVYPSDALSAVQLNSIPEGKERIAQNLADDFWQEALRNRAVFSTLSTDKFRTRAMRLRSDARSAEEDSGANNLYLALGSVSWGHQYGDFVSPVFLVPLRVKIGRGDRVLTIVMDDTQSTVPNYCLIEALRAREQVSLQWFGDDMADDFGLDVEAGLEELRKEFRERGLDTRGFSVNQSATLALLDFKKFRLWKDLADHWKDFAEKPLVSHLIDTPRLAFKDPAGDAAVTVDDTSLLTPQPADGSQLRAIARALVGQSFVLEGPPGTGKSQTITNLLANAMRGGKKVLFVAEKQAALGVVYERLEQVGLGPYCLQLHDSGTKPEDMRKQLKEALEHAPSLDERAFNQLEEDFAAAARHLDQYRLAVHSKNDAGFSFAGAYEALNRLGSGPIAELPRETLSAGVEAIAAIRRRLLELADVAVPAQPRPQHPWAFAGPGEFDSLNRSELGDVVRTSADLAKSLGAVGDRAGVLLASLSDHVELRSGAALLQLIELAWLPATSEWAQIGTEQWESQVRPSIAGIRSVLADADTLIPNSVQVLRRTDLQAIASDVQTALGTFAIGRKGRVKAAMRDLAPLAGPESGIVEAAPRLMAGLTALAQRLSAEYSSIRGAAGLTSCAPELPISEQEIAAVERRVTLLQSAAIAVRSTGADGTAARDLLGSGSFPVPGLADSVSRLAETLAALVQILGGDVSSVRRWTLGGSVIQQISTAASEAWSDDVDSGTFLRLQRWLGLQNELQALREVGLTAFADDLSSGVIHADTAASAFERGVLTTTMRVRAEEKNLDVFDRVQHDRRVAKFIELLEKRRDAARAAIPFGLARLRKVQSGISIGRIGEFRNEIGKPARGRGKSVRNLISKYPEIVSDLAPCFLMSPDSVAQFVPAGSVDFDVAVFDEASQITVADAIGVLGRARSAVIVGDSRQMPPTRFGVAGSGDNDDTAGEADGTPLEEESILEEALQAGLDQEWLSWHYRSQDESLIDFSNINYYESKLATFPSPADSRTDCGIFYRRVNGRFDHGGSRTNRIEAEAIVEELVRRLDDPATAGLTYGIITLNIQQRALIEGLLDTHVHDRVRELRESEDPERRLFVLNLENVQGRERDIILMGTSFSKRANGAAMPLQFGPLTQKGGEKRLNVAITRARRQFVVVSSFDSTEMTGANSLGMVHLRDYLARAEQGGNKRPAEAADGPAAELVQHLATRLRDMGLLVQERRGMSTFKIDLALGLPEQPNRWLVAVLLDGKEWESRPLAADRDALPTIILKNMMGWPQVARVWLPAWILEPDQVLADLVDATRAAAVVPPPAPPAPAPVVAGVRNPDVGDAAAGPPSVMVNVEVAAGSSGSVGAALPGEEPWMPHADPSLLGRPDQLHPANPKAQSLARAIVTAEGPVSREAVIKRVAKAFGLARVLAVRLAELGPLLDDMVATDLGFGTFCWPPGRSPESWRGFRPSPSADRVIDAVAPEEMVNLMEAMTRIGLGISRDRLVQETASFFGNRRLTEGIKHRIGEIVDVAIESGRLVENDGLITLP